MKFKDKLLIYLMKNISSCYWYTIDNLAFKLDKLAEIYYKKSIGTEYKSEYQKFSISKSDKVLHIGSGAFPLTEITLAETIGNTVVGVDKDLKAVISANNAISRRNLQDKIEINHGNGIDYPVKDFDIVIVSSCASPMVKIVDHVFKNAKKNCKIIVREMEILTKPLVKYIDTQQNVTLIKKIDHHPFPFLKPFGWESYYIIKNNE